MSSPSEQSLVPYEAVTDLGRGRALVLAPHPDDEVFGCGGAIARHVSAGDPVHVVVVTDGGHVGAEPADAERYVREREEESRAAAQILGYGEPAFWRLPDRSLEYGERLVERITVAIADSAAEIIYAPSVYEMHPDHRVVGMCAVEAVRRCGRNATLAMYEVATPLRPNRLLDITALVPVKARAMAVFRSQLQRQAYDRHITALNCFRTYTLPPSVEAAEGYLLLDTYELRERWPDLYGSELERHRRDGVDLDCADAPLVSAVVRGVNPPAELRRTLDALALQTHPRMEIVVVHPAGDAGRAREPWCGRFPLRHVDAPAGANTAATANAGLDAVSGQYLMLLNPGDIVAPDHVAVLVRKLSSQEAPAVAVMLGPTCTEDELPGASDGAGAMPPAASLLCGPRVPVGAALIDGSLACGNGARFDEALQELEDWDFWLQLSARAPLLPCAGTPPTPGPRTLSCQRMDGNGAGGGSEWHAVRGRWQRQWNVDHLHEVLVDYDRRVAESMATLRHHLEAERSRRIATEEALDLVREHERRLSNDLQQVLTSRSWRAMSLARHGSSALRRVLNRLGRGSQLSH